MMTDYILEPALDVPGIEGVWEYNNFRINDRSVPERLRITRLSGLQDDADLRDAREPNSDRPGERAGVQLPGGRTIAAEGVLEAGSIPSIRKLWRLTKRALDGTERDLKIRVPFETHLYYNSILNPAPYVVGASPLGWGNGAATGGSTPGVAVATDGNRSVLALQVTNTGAGSGSFDNVVGIQWDGQDIWSAVTFKMLSAPATPTSVSMSYQFNDRTGAAISTSTVVSQTAPATGTSYNLSTRFSRDSVPAGTVNFLVRITLTYGSTTGSYNLYIMDVAAVLLAPTEASPPGHFDGTSPGFEWEGLPAQSRSYGPLYQINGIPDPQTRDIRELIGAPTLWANGSSAGATINTSPTVQRDIGVISLADHVIYMKATNPDATARTIGIQQDISGAGVPMKVYPGRTYRATYSIKIIQSASKVPTVRIVFVNSAGTTVGSATASGAASTAEQVLTVTGIAPASATSAYTQVTFAATATAQAFEFYVGNPSLIDISDYDPGSTADFSGDNTDPYSCLTIDSRGYYSGSIRRIPRPWLVRRVRKADKPSSPEEQTDAQIKRNFLMTLRASDPRIYMEEQVKWMTMSGTNSSYESGSPRAAPIDTNAPIDIAGNSMSVGTNENPTHLHYYQGASGALRMRNDNDPTARGRMEFSAIPSLQPWVRIKGVPAFANTSTIGTDFGGMYVLIKWINANNYLYAKWSYFNLQTRLELYSVVAGGAPVQLGSAVTINDNLARFAPNVWIMCWMDAAHNVFANVYTKFPDTNYTLPTPIMTLTFNIPAGATRTALGSTVSGRPGFGMIAVQVDGTFFTIDNSAEIYTYEAADLYANSQGTMMTIPVLGDFEDIPFKIYLNNGIQYPTITLTSPDGAVSTISLTGQKLASAIAPDLLDFDSGYFRSAQGYDMWSTVKPFYDRLVLKPGTNTIRVNANNWSVATNTPHIGVQWRAAMK